MKISLVLGAMALLCHAFPQLAAAQGAVDSPPSLSSGEQQKLDLSSQQRRAIYAAVSKDTSKTASKQFPATIGADVPPMIELYTLPDQVLAEDHAAKFYEYTLMQNKVVLVDPTRMRVVDVIDPPPRW